MNHSAIITATGSAVPNHIETNDMLALRFDTSDEWIRQRTGIRQRHIATTESTVDLAVTAGRQALDLLDFDYQVDQLILATTTPGRACPAIAPEVAHRLNLGTIPAYDVAAVCSGFLFGLRTARDSILAGTSKRTLVIAAETFTSLLDPADRATAALFGDGAGAAVVEAGTLGIFGAVHALELCSDGSLSELIMASGHPTSIEHVEEAHDPYFRMQGQTVFLQAVLRMEEVTRRVLEDANWPIDTVAHFVGHQANARILNAVADRLNIEGEKVCLHLERVGNTAGASIALALDDALRSGRILPGERVAMASFGGGLTWGAAAITAPDINSTNASDA